MSDEIDPLGASVGCGCLVLFSAICTTIVILAAGVGWRVVSWAWRWSFG